MHDRSVGTPGWFGGVKRFSIPGLVWAILVACALWLISNAVYFIFHEKGNVVAQQQISLSYFLLCALLTWSCVKWLNPVLERIYPLKLAPRLLFGLLIVFSGVIFITMGVYFHLFPHVMARPVNALGLLVLLHKTITCTLLVYGWLVIRNFLGTQHQRATRLLLETDALATDLDRSELAMLEAQIEPHFLFNTLAHVKRLYRLDAHCAGQILSTLIDYLQRALPALRRSDWSIADETELITLYLSLLAQRFGERLRYHIEVAPALAGQQIPALAIATLVENAVRHGLAPKTGGGMVHIAVASSGSGWFIEVSDDGVGLKQSSGSGLGLATVRARLRSRFGNQATLVVEPAAAGGVRATIRIAQGSWHGH